MVTVNKPAGNEAFKAFVDASAGAMGSLFAAVLLYPLDVVKTRQQVSVEGGDDTNPAHAKKRPSNMFSLCWAIFKAEGLGGLFAGLSSKMAHTLFASFAYFYWYATLKQAAERRSGKTISTGMNLIVAAAAGALNMSMTLPLEMINTRAQITASDSDSDSDSESLDKKTPQHKGMWDLTKEIYSEGGLLAFWKGYIPSLVLVSNPSINFTVFDKLKLRMQQWKTSGSGEAKRLVALTMFEAFVIAAFAKAIATILTYPVIRAKVLMQAQKKHLESETSDAKSNPQQAAHQPTHHHHHHHERKDYGDSMLAVLQNIGTREGLPGYFKGCSAQLFNTVIKSALLLMTKEQIYTYTMRVLYSLRREKVAAAAAAAAAKA